MQARKAFFHSPDSVLLINTCLLLTCALLVQSAAIISNSTTSSTTLSPSPSPSPSPSSSSSSTTTTETPASPGPDSQADPSIESKVVASPSPSWLAAAKIATGRARKWPVQKPSISAEGGAYLPLYPPFPPHVAENEADTDDKDGTAEGTAGGTAGGTADGATGGTADGAAEEATAEGDDEEAEDDDPLRPTVIPNIECPEKTGVQSYAHPEQCDQFYLCTNGTLTLERCQNGLLFKGGPGSVHNHCHYHWDVDCNDRNKEMVALSTESCEYQFGMYPETEMDGCSNKYIVCEFGRARTTECAPGLAYDPRSHRCNWPDEMMDLKCEPKNIVGFECPEGMPEDPVSARFWPYPRFALKGDCQRLITCVNGHPRLITCDADMVVDDSTLTCEEPELVPNCAHFAKQEDIKL